MATPDLLTLNDPQAEHPPSWYAASVDTGPARPGFTGSAQADVCVIGGGYTGLNAALELAQRGYEVVLLEARRIGFGASGRNGGQVGSGQRLEQPELERWLGDTRARALWRLAEDAKRRVKRLISEHGIECDLQPGIAYTAHRARHRAEYRALGEHLRTRYGYQHLAYLEGDEARAWVASPEVHCALLDHDAAHLHPLAFTLGVAKAAEGAGATLFEHARVTAIEPGARVRVRTAQGEVRARFVIAAGNGYLGELLPQVHARVQPINNFLVATEPLGEARASALIRPRIAVCDSRFVVNYYRMSADHRLVFGGGEAHGARFPRDIAGLVRRRMLQVFPQLADTRVEHAWGGTLAITARRMPHFRRLGANIFSASGYSGHGVALATLGGELCARAVDGDSADFDLMASVPARRFPGGRWLRSLMVSAALKAGAMRDGL